MDSADIPDDIKIYAGIGVVCVQWSLLEHLMLGIIACAEDEPLEKIFLAFGNLDMLPRINIALNLTRYAKWPNPLIERIKDIRKALQGPNGKHGLQERRNQVVHGVHKSSDARGSTSLTMVRWGEPKRTQDVSMTDIHDLAHRLGALANEADAIMKDYGQWRFSTR